MAENAVKEVREEAGLEAQVRRIIAVQDRGKHNRPPLYNRCHLIGYQLSGENANRQNLITGTRYLNVEGMLPFENLVADYVQEGVRQEVPGRRQHQQQNDGAGHALPGLFLLRRMAGFCG